MTAPTVLCSHDDCDRPPVARGRCKRHYVAYRKRMSLYGKWEIGYVDANAARDRVLALVDAGMPLAQIAARIYTDPCVVQRLKNHPGGEGLQASRRVVDAILALDPSVVYTAYLDAADEAHVDGTGSRRRLRSLVAVGWPQRELAERCDWVYENLNTFINHEDRGLTAAAARRVAAVFTELQLHPEGGPSTKSRRLARAKGWVPPLAWDEDTIDDPHARPAELPDDDREHIVDEILVERCVAAWRSKTPTPYIPREDRPAVAAALLRAGAPRTSASELVGWSRPTLAKRLSA